jgi:hypothetical protein
VALVCWLVLVEAKEGWEHGKCEVGRRVVTESATGEEVSIRKIKLDDTDGGEAEIFFWKKGALHTQETAVPAPLVWSSSLLLSATVISTSTVSLFAGTLLGGVLPLPCLHSHFGGSSHRHA